MKIGLPEVSLGVLPGTGGTQRLSRLIGQARAFELMARGATLPVDEALALGLVSQVFDEADFWPRVLELARSFCPPAKAARAVGRIKCAVMTGWDVPLESGLALERELQQQLFLSRTPARAWPRSARNARPNSPAVDVIQVVHGR